MLTKLASIRLFFWLLGLILVACVVGAVVPQGEASEKYDAMFGTTAAHLILGMGLDKMFSSAWFTLLLAALGVNLTACSVQRIRTIRSRPGVFVTHVAVLVILVGSTVRWVWGVHGVLPMRVGDAATKFYVGNERTRALPLPFEVRLDDFTIDYRSPALHRLQITDHSTMKQETFTFDRPGTYKLNPLDAEVRVLGIYPDFMMDENGPTSRSDQQNNPALQIEIVKNGHSSKRWLFAKFPDFNEHGTTLLPSPQGGEGSGDMACCATIQAQYEIIPGDIGQFRSRLSILENGRAVAEKTIHVNEPMRHKGYVFYQSGYDPKDPAFSSLQVAKDPSVPIVYAGFALLPVGLVWSFLQNPKSQ